MPCWLLLTRPSVYGPNSFPLREGFGCLELYVRLTDDVEARVLIAVSRLFTDSPDGHHFYSRWYVPVWYLQHGSKKGMFRYVQTIFDCQTSSTAFASSSCCCCCCCGGGGGEGELGPLGSFTKSKKPAGLGWRSARSFRGRRGISAASNWHQVEVRSFMFSSKWALCMWEICHDFWQYLEDTWAREDVLVSRFTLESPINLIPFLLYSSDPKLSNDTILLYHRSHLSNSCSWTSWTPDIH